MGFEIYRIANANNGSHGIEKAPRGRCVDGIDAALNHGSNGCDLLGRDAAEKRQIERINLAPEGIEQVAQAEPPRFANGPVATRQRNIAEVTTALETSEIGDQKFAAPYLSVAAKSSSIERHANHFVRDPVLGHAACDMGVMMLDADVLNVRHL